MYNNFLETKMESNFARIGEIWKQQALAEGRAEGLARGKVEGKAIGKAIGEAMGKAIGKVEGKTEAKAEDLVCLLVERFGALAPSLLARIRRARLATLERWFKRAIAAPDLRSVFNSPRSRRVVRCGGK